MKSTSTIVRYFVNKDDLIRMFFFFLFFFVLNDASTLVGHWRQTGRMEQEMHETGNPGLCWT